jgi:hypothetical protein
MNLFGVSLQSLDDILDRILTSVESEANKKEEKVN